MGSGTVVVFRLTVKNNILNHPREAWIDAVDYLFISKNYNFKLWEQLVEVYLGGFPDF